jgi:parallel beta-helix repeat protein
VEGDVTDVDISGNLINGKVHTAPGGANGINGINNNMFTGDYGRAIHAGGAAYNIVTGNEIAGYEKYCTALTGGASSNHVYTGNSCSDSGDGFTSNLALVGLIGTVGNVVIDSNSIVGKANGNAVIHGIDCNNQTNVVVSDNVIASTDGLGITRCAVQTGNTIISAGTDAISVGADGAIVANNRIISAGSESIIVFNKDYVNVTGNYIYDSAGTAAIYFDGTTGSNISDNIINTANNEGIQCDDCTYTRITGNTVGGTASPGIYILESATSSDYNTVFGNTNLDSGETILGGDGTSAGDDVGCTAEPTGNGVPTAYAPAGGGQVTVTSNGHGIDNGTAVTISGSTNYNGTFTAANVAANTFEITDTWVVDDCPGNCGVWSTSTNTYCGGNILTP